MAKWLIMRSRERQFFFAGAIQEFSLYCMAHSQKEQQQQKKFCLLPPLPCFHTYFFTSFHSCQLFSLRYRFCTDFSYFYLPYTSVGLFYNVQDSQDIVKRHRFCMHCVPFILFALYKIKRRCEASYCVCFSMF